MFGLTINNFTWIYIMARVKKSISQKEQELLHIIKDAKDKLHKLQNKQRLELGELACKYKLNEFDLSIIEDAFKELATKLSKGKNN